jgi:hypothetical protein
VRPDEQGKILVHRVGEADCLVLIEGADIGADSMEKRGGIAGGANENACALGRRGWRMGYRLEEVFWAFRYGQFLA